MKMRKRKQKISQLRKSSSDKTTYHISHFTIHNSPNPTPNVNCLYRIVWLPGKQSLEKQQYYGNPRNHFWPIIGQLFDIEIPENYEQKLDMLRSKGIGLWDSIQSCEREGSLDATIKNEIPNDFQKLFQQFPQIQLVLFNGGKSFDVFKKHVGLTLLAGRAYQKMPSTSPIPGKNIKS